MPQDHSWCAFGGRESHGGQAELDGFTSLQSTARDLPALRAPQQELDRAAKPFPSLSRARNDACARYQAQSFAALQVQNSSRRRRARTASRTRSAGRRSDQQRCPPPTSIQQMRRTATKKYLNLWRIELVDITRAALYGQERSSTATRLLPARAATSTSGRIERTTGPRRPRPWR